MSERGWRDSYGDGGGDRFAGVKRVLARIFGDGEDPLAWGFAFARLSGVVLKAHLLFIVWVLAELIFTMPGHQEGVKFVGPRLVGVWLIVSVKEFVRARVCVRHGGVCDSVMLWPMGALAQPELPESRRGVWMTALSGLMAQVVIGAVLGGVLVGLTGSGAGLMFNPLEPASAIGGLTLRDGTTAWWLVALWSVYAVNLVILVVNLLPMDPLDGARVVRAVLEPARGEMGARGAVSVVGVVCATVVGIVGLVTADGTTLFAIAVVCGVVVTIERQRIRFLRTASLFSDPAVSRGSGGAGEHGGREERSKEGGVDPEEVDRVLAKISVSGVESLTRGERRTLKRATKSSRDTE